MRCRACGCYHEAFLIRRARYRERSHMSFRVRFLWRDRPMSSSVEQILPFHCKSASRGHRLSRWAVHNLTNVSIITTPAIGVGLLSGEKTDLVQNLLSLAVGPKDSQQFAWRALGRRTRQFGFASKSGGSLKTLISFVFL